MEYAIVHAKPDYCSLTVATKQNRLLIYIWGSKTPNYFCHTVRVRVTERAVEHNYNMSADTAPRLNGSHIESSTLRIASLSLPASSRAFNAFVFNFEVSARSNSTAATSAASQTEAGMPARRAQPMP